MRRSVDVWAPGRVNLIGEHTDYTGGLVLPMAIDLGTRIVGFREPDGAEVHLRSASEPEPALVPVDVTDAMAVDPVWARYVAGVVVATDLRVGFDGDVTTTIPVGTGLSSSAALEVAVALALGADDDGRADRAQLAEVLRSAEHLASGVPCGVMDQLACLCGAEGKAVLLDCHTLDVSLVDVPSDAEIVIVDSGERRTLSAVPYAERRDEAVAAVELLGGPGAPSVVSSSDASAITDPLLRRRARHVVSECERVRGVAAALAAGDLETAGQLMVESHASMRDDFEMTTPGIDALVARLVDTPGVYGARLTGGGWGGCVVALCAPGALLDEGWHVRPSAGASVRLS